MSATARFQRTEGDATREGDWFAANRFGLFIHWGLYSVPARGEWAIQHERTPPAEYERYAEFFTPDRFDPDDWAARAYEAGMRYMVVTAKHHEGYAMWDSATTSFGAARTGPGRDLLRPILDAFRGRGFKVGVYYSLLDWHHPAFAVDGFHPLRRAQELPPSMSREGDIEEYRVYMRRQLEELLTSYGHLDLVWFDFSYPDDVWGGKGRCDWGSESIVELVRRLQPDALINDRLDLPGSEDFVTPERHIPWELTVSSRPRFWEIGQSLTETWGYCQSPSVLRGAGSVIRMLVEAASRGGNLILNVGPTARGELEPLAREVLGDLKEWMGRNSRALYSTSPARVEPAPGCRYTCSASSLFVHLFDWPEPYLFLPHLGDKVRFARWVGDGSEVRIAGEDPPATPSALRIGRRPSDLLTLELPNRVPPGPVPVIELFTTEDLRA